MLGWKTDNYKFVGKAFDMRYANRINTLAPLLGTKTTNSIDYELTGAGGFGEMQPYDGENVNKGSLKRGFKTIITPGEFSTSIPVGYKEAKIDKSGECRKVGTRLADSASMTVYMHVLRCFGGRVGPECRRRRRQAVGLCRASCGEPRQRGPQVHCG